MKKMLMLALMAMLAMAVFAPLALAQDDNPSADDAGLDDNGGEAAPSAPDDNPSADDAGLDDNGGAAAPSAPDDNPSPSDLGAASQSQYGANDDGGAAAPSAVPVLPDTGGPASLPIAGLLLILSGSLVMLLRRRLE